MNTSTKAVLATLLLGVLPAASMPANAGAFTQTGNSACVGASWQDEQALVRSATGILNVATRQIRVICSMDMHAVQIPPNTQYAVTALNVLFSNTRARSTRVGCVYSMPGGWEDPIQISFSIRANGYYRAAIAPVQYRADQSTYALSCTLPPGVQISTITGRTMEWEFIEMQ